jgi:predicted DsbA family dithiol-disulfide isomerase
VRQLMREDPSVEVVWRAFELRPEPVPTLDPNGVYLETVWRDSVYPLAKKLGIPIKLPPVQPRSRRAHEAAHWARAQGRFDEYNTALFRAFFERGEDIGDVAVLTALARALNLDADALALALECRDFESAVGSDERDARQLGISAVPAFVADRRARLPGVQPVENVRRLIGKVREPASRTEEI